MSSPDPLAIVGRLTPDDRATFGRYHDEKIFKKSADCRSVNGRPSPDASPMTKPLKIGGSVNKTFNLGASTKSRRPTKKSTKIGADVGRQSADVARFSHFLLTDRRETVSLGNVSVVLFRNQNFVGVDMYQYTSTLNIKTMSDLKRTL